MPDEPKKTCFIITPIGKPTDPIRRHIDGVVQGIKDAIGGEFDVVVAHEMFEVGSINRQVMQLIYTSDLVITNLTNLNPNVMYELAFRHSVGRPAIVIAEAGTVLPFDVKDERAFEYINDYIGIKVLGEVLRNCIANINFSDPTPRSPIHTMIVGFHFEQRVMATFKDVEAKEMMQTALENIESTILEKIASIGTGQGAPDENQLTFDSWSL
ncbi:MAG: hypothetical protein LBB75_05285 [Oscillospiraceae bacterium]|jgi:hypothetical protein|nr:hypothetical protein [Oscillospiraceae bacterium]